MGAQHTPGPWDIFRLNAKNGLLVVGVRGPFGPQKHIAEICWARDVADKETGATGLGDARLIAAAPELLDFCLALRLHLSRGAPAREGDALRLQLDAAIAKATGQ